MNSLVEISCTYVAYHNSRSYNCLDFTIGVFGQGTFYQIQNTEYGLAVL